MITCPCCNARLDVDVTPAAVSGAVTGSALAATLAAQGVFKGFHGLEGFAECDAFWEQQPYGTRLYYGDGGADYLHRDVLRAAVRALKRPNGKHSDTAR